MPPTDVMPIPELFTAAIERFLRIEKGRNRSPQTLRAYRSDLTQLATWLHEDNPYLTDPVDVTCDDLSEYLASLAHRGVSGVSRARKLAAIREFYRSLKNSGLIDHSPVDAVDTTYRHQIGEKPRGHRTPYCAPPARGRLYYRRSRQAR